MRNSLGSAGTVSWPLTDHLGTVRDIVQDAGGSATVVDHNSYDSFGNKLSQSSAASDIFFGFTGRAFDTDTGLQNNHHRWLQNGRWLSEDPIKDGVNWYAYGSNSP
ncbi:MAG: hypothetical protein IT427_15570, partial [Pirellulales bacterium]|nr:hypothetical protein [Pirellulales bacterium]